MKPLGRYFTWEEFEHSDTAKRLGIDNSIPIELAPAARALVKHTLDPFRKLLRAPLRLSSGFRCPELNSAIGGAPNSQHKRGEAVDCFTSLSSQEAVQKLVRSRIPFDQAIWYDRERGGHMHISYSSTHNRRQVLHATKGGGYVQLNPKTGK